VKFRKVLSIVSIVIAVAASIPSAAAFTPAVFLSLLALLIAAIPAFLGEVKLTLVTFAIVSVTVFLISPITSVQILKQQPSILLVLAVPYGVYLLALITGIKKTRA